MDIEGLNLLGMKCLSPRLVYVKAWDDEHVCLRSAPLFVPCGKCYNCLSARRQSWQFRLEMESLGWENSTFVTLTLDDAHLHDLRKSDLQNFFKRLRSRGYEFKYYAIGEYGTRTHRPHYHALLFCDDVIAEDVQRCWPLGLVKCGSVTPNSIGYVLHYHVRPKLVDGKPTFCLMSKGLGVSWFNLEMQKFVEQKKDFFVHNIHGTRSILPRYYRKKFLSPKDFVPEARLQLPRGLIHDIDYLASLREAFAEKLKKYNEQDKF